MLTRKITVNWSILTSQIGWSSPINVVFLNQKSIQECWLIDQLTTINQKQTWILGMDVFPETSWWMKPEGYCSIAPSVLPNHSGQMLSQKDPRIPPYFPNWTLSHRIWWEYSYRTPPWWKKNMVSSVKRVKRRGLPFESIDSGWLLIRLQSSTPWRFHHPQRDCWAKKLGRLALQWLGDWGKTPSLNIWLKNDSNHFSGYDVAICGI